MSNSCELTDRQKREIEYHAHRAERLREVVKPISYDVLTAPPRSRWWNHYWAAFALLTSLNLRGKSVLVPGCGEGTDAIRLGALGGDVHAFDISGDMVRVAEARAAKERIAVEFATMACERLVYADNSFDVLFVHDVLHHCDVPRSIAELIRVSKPGAYWVIDELYTHRTLQRVRQSRAGCWCQSKMVPYIYPNRDIYITEDERKLNEVDLFGIRAAVANLRCEYFNMAVGRVMPTWDLAAKIDRTALKVLGPLGYLCAGRFILSGWVRK